MKLRWDQKWSSFDFFSFRHTIDSATEGNERKVYIPEVNNIPNANGYQAIPCASIPCDGSDDDKKKKKRDDPKPLFELPDESAGSYGEEDDSRDYGVSVKYANRIRNSDNSLGECPILDAIDKRCESVDLLGGSGGRNVFEKDLLLPACSMHQFCYLCVSKLFCEYIIYLRRAKILSWSLFPF